jgi:heme oxygenase
MPQLRESRFARALSAVHHLRRATQRRHQRLHGHTLLRRLTSKDLALGEYLRALRAFYGFYATWDPLLVAAAEHSGYRLLYPRSLRLEWLTEDLRGLGQDPEKIGDLPRTPAGPAVAGPGELAGCLYVIEGSARGAAHIITCLARSRLAEAVVLPTRFFAAYGPELTEHWQRLSAWLELRLDERGARAQAMGAARRTFAALERWLNACA